MTEQDMRDRSDRQRKMRPGEIGCVVLASVFSAGQDFLAVAVFALAAWGVSAAVNAAGGGFDTSSFDLSDRVAKKHVQDCESCRFGGLTSADLASGAVGVRHWEGDRGGSHDCN